MLDAFVIEALTRERQREVAAAAAGAGRVGEWIAPERNARRRRSGPTLRSRAPLAVAVLAAAAVTALVRLVA